MSDLAITEIFHSIQGESSWAGLPCVFVRLMGCHLRCRYCDTEYAFHEGSRRSLDEVLAEVRRLAGGGLVEVTGGEPLLQPGVHELMSRLCDLGYTVLLESSGACDISACDPRVIRIVDIKTPGSGEIERNLWSNLSHLTSRDEVKFVLTSRTDYEWARDVIRRERLHERVRTVLLSPVQAVPPGKELPGSSGLSLRDLAEWMLADTRAGLLPGAGAGAGNGTPTGVRLQVQLHKLIWDPATRGV